MDGVFIALDGTDSSITETQFRLLADNLRNAGYDVETLEFPQLEQPSSHFIRESQQGTYGSEDDIGPYTGSLFYVLDHFHAAPQIRQSVKAGKVVLVMRYTGATMAEQGQKFVRPEERRGFYLWLESMETRMFGLPRPAANIILRSSPGQLNTHLDNPSLLTESYEDLCQLFPRDYMRLDITRGGAVLPEKTIQSLILAKITPLLPVLPASTGQDSVLPSKTPSTQLNGHNAVDTFGSSNQPHEKPIKLSDVSELLAGDLMAIGGKCITEVHRDTASKPSYYVPSELDEKTKSAYKTHMDRIFDLYDKMADTLASREGTRARQILSPVLPLATQIDLGLNNLAGCDTTASDILDCLQRMPSSEASRAAQTLRSALKTEVSEPSPASSPANTDTSMNALASKYLAGTYAASDLQSVVLLDAWPRNEFDLIPYMLFTMSSLPLNNLRHAVGLWSYEQKAEVLRAYLKEQVPETRTSVGALKIARYTWDIVSDYSTLRHFQSLGLSCQVSHQFYTPRYGFDVPDSVIDAELTDDYEECFAISLKLHSILQSAGYDEHSQYATLRGHKQRWQITMDGTQLFRLFTLSDDSETGFPTLKLAMQEQISLVHPMIAEIYKSGLLSEEDA